MTGGSLSANGQWMNVSGTMLQIQSATDPRTDGNTYTAALRDDLVNSNAHNHLVFRNIDGDESAMNDNGGHSGYSFLIQNSADVQIQNCNAYRAGKHHFSVINSTGFVELI